MRFSSAHWPTSPSPGAKHAPEASPPWPYVLIRRRRTPSPPCSATNKAPYWAGIPGASSPRIVRPSSSRLRLPCKSAERRARFVLSQSCSRLACVLPFGAHFPGDARHLGGEGAQLVDHLVDGFLELEDLALRWHGDLAGEIPAGDGGGDQRDVADLVRQVPGQDVYVVGEIFPHPRHP